MKEIGEREVLRKISETCSITGLREYRLKIEKLDPDHRTKFVMKNLPTLDSSKE
jgi:hypothetical protein